MRLQTTPPQWYPHDMVGWKTHTCALGLSKRSLGPLAPCLEVLLNQTSTGSCPETGLLPIRRMLQSVVHAVLT